MDGRIVGVRDIVDREARERSRRNRLTLVARWIAILLMPFLALYFLAGFLVGLLGTFDASLFQQPALLTLVGTLIGGLVGALLGGGVSIASETVARYFLRRRERRLRATDLPLEMRFGKVSEALQRLGYTQTRHIGDSHLLLTRSSDGNSVYVPKISPVPPAPLRTILQEAGIPVKEFRNTQEAREAIGKHRSWWRRLRGS